MKTRQGFVSNSSSTSFLIQNTSNERKTLVDFVDENPQLLQQYVREYGFISMAEEGYTKEGLRKSADQRDIVWEPGEIQSCVFGDEDGTVVGAIFDYVLRDGGRSKSFKWDYEESLR